MMPAPVVTRGTLPITICAGPHAKLIGTLDGEGLLDVTPIHPKRKLSDEDVDAIAIAVTKSIKKYLEED